MKSESVNLIILPIPFHNPKKWESPARSSADNKLSRSLFPACPGVKIGSRRNAAHGSTFTYLLIYNAKCYEDNAS
jgi:hypothetical protein